MQTTAITVGYFLRLPIMYQKFKVTKPPLDLFFNLALAVINLVYYFDRTFDDVLVGKFA